MFFANTAFAQETIVGWTFPATSADGVVDNAIEINSSRFISCEHGFQDFTGYYEIPIDYTTNGALVSTVADDKCAKASGFDNGQDSVYWMIKFKTQGYGNLKLYSKQRAGNNPAGPRDFKVQYKFSGETVWYDLTTVVCGNDWTTGVIDGIDLPAECDNLDKNISIRWIMSSNTDISGGTVAAEAISKIDEIVITGTALSNIAKNSTNSNIRIYPNPSKGNFTIDCKKDIKNLNVTNLLGKSVYQTSEIERNLNISNLPKGFYFVLITDSDNNLYSHKVVVE